MRLEATPTVMHSLRAALAEAIQPYLGGAARPDATGRTQSRRRRGRPAGSLSTSAAPRDLLPLNDAQWRRIGRDILALHEGYTQRTASFTHEANPIHARAAGYQLYFLPRNWFRVWRVLSEMPWAAQVAGSPAVPPDWLTAPGGQDTLHLLDLGCGSGAYSLAWLAWLSERRAHATTNAAPSAAPAAARSAAPPPLVVHLTLVDQGHELLELAQANLRAFARRALPGVELRCEAHADGVQPFLAAPPERTYAVAGAAMTLNELALLGPRRVSARAEALSGALRRLVRPGGCLLFAEPGTRRGYMNLMTLREHLVALPVLYPCPHNAACPMWDGAVRHWCHASVRLPPDFFFDAELRARAGLAFKMHDLELAALAVQAIAGALPAAPFRPRAGERVVSAPLRVRPPKGARAAPGRRGSELPAAGPDSLERVVLACAPDARLHERPAPNGGPYTRGLWLDAPMPATP